MTDRSDARCAFARIGGEPIIQRQLERACEAGCRTVLCHVDRIDAEIIELQIDVERAGLAFVAFERVRDLMGLMSGIDKLTIIQDGLSIGELPPNLAQNQVWTFPERAVSAGFERIDRHRSWAGVMTIDSDLVEGLTHMSPDIDIASSLLRVALQANVGCEPIDEAFVVDTYEQVDSQADAANASRRLFDADLDACSRATPTSLLALWLTARLLLRNFDPAVVVRGVASVTVALLFASALMASNNATALAFAALAAGALTLELMRQVANRIVGVIATRWWMHRGVHFVRAAFDVSLVLVIASAGQGEWSGHLFAAIMMLGSLYLVASNDEGGTMADLLSDRGILVTILLIATPTEALLPIVQIIACAALVVLLIRAFKPSADQTVTIA